MTSRCIGCGSGTGSTGPEVAAAHGLEAPLNVSGAALAARVRHPNDQAARKRRDGIWPHMKNRRAGVPALPGDRTAQRGAPHGIGYAASKHAGQIAVLGGQGMR